MKAILLFISATTAITLFSGCESDLPENPRQPSVVFGNNQWREDGNERPAGLATDRDRNVW